MASFFGEYVKVVEVVASNTLLVQVNKNICVNSHVGLFQDGILMVKLQSLYDTIGNLPWVPGK